MSYDDEFVTTYCIKQKLAIYITLLNSCFLLSKIIYKFRIQNKIKSFVNQKLLSWLNIHFFITRNKGFFVSHLLNRNKQ